MRTKTLVVTLSLLVLSGCASYWDRRDPCQTRAELGRPAGYQPPAWCGASADRINIRNNAGQIIGYIK